MSHYDRYDRGEIGYDELFRLQQNAYPRCINHPGRPAPAHIPDGYVCEECGCLWILETTLWRKAQGVVIGGLEGV